MEKNYLDMKAFKMKSNMYMQTIRFLANTHKITLTFIFYCNRNNIILKFYTGLYFETTAAKIQIFVIFPYIFDESKFAHLIHSGLVDIRRKALNRYL